MMIITHDCPRCGGNSLGFTLVALIKRNHHSESCAFFRCPKCGDPITVFIENKQGWDLKELRGDIKDEDPYVRIMSIEPASPVTEVPDCTPDLAASYYVEACDSLYRQKWTSAAAMFRKCLEVTLKEFAPDVEAWKLEKRIDKLAADNLITPALKDWAHELRLDGNEALHGTALATEDLAVRMERLTHFLLTYLYTLPAQVAAAREARGSGLD